MVRELELDACRTSSARCSTTMLRLARMSAAMLRSGRPHAADEIADELVALARR